MNVFSISWQSLKANKLTAILNVLLITFGTGILTVLLLVSYQINDKLENNSKDIDLVVGAKGSPLQLILSSIFYIDFPTGNIALTDAESLAKSPMVKSATPLALGDNYSGFRIVGTDSNYIRLYGLELKTGRFWKSDLEVTVGSTVAQNRKLKLGDEFFGAHGLTGGGDIHKDHAYRVVGVLEAQGSVVDNLILTNIASIWKMHEPEDEHEDHETGKAHEEGKMPAEIQDKEITSLLIQYRSPMSVVMFPRLVNKSTNMQAASPAMESARLFSLIGVGVNTLEWFAYLIMLISAVSVFISLYNSLKERKYDLAIMRTMGASRAQIFYLVLLEGVLLTLIGTIAGIAMGHVSLSLISHFQDSTQAKLSGTVFLIKEFYILLSGISIGIVAALIPAVQAYRSDISKILSKH
jgi:putative ABC transport system permease protein